MKEPPPHGTIAARTRHMSLGEKPCDECREAHRAYEFKRTKRLATGDRRFNQSLVPSWPIVRRLEALLALGWTQEEVFEVANLPPGKGRQKLSQIRTTKRMSPITAARIRLAYDLLCGTPAPQTHTSRMLVTRSKTRGYAPPLAWDDIDNKRERPKGIPD